jgi:Ca2+-transporting ATPase
MAWKGTLVTHGRATGLVVATGAGTELGRIAGLLAQAERRSTPLQQRLTAFGRRLSTVVLGLCAVVFAIGVLRGEPVLLMGLTAISLAVAAIPEALPAVVTVLLALGARRLVRVQALVRQLPAVETLGSVTTICSDKTGTLTRNRMQVQAWRLADPPPAPEALLREAALRCNDARAARRAGRANPPRWRWPSGPVPPGTAPGRAPPARMALRRRASAHEHADTGHDPRRTRPRPGCGSRAPRKPCCPAAPRPRPLAGPGRGPGRPGHAGAGPGAAAWTRRPWPPRPAPTRSNAS